VISGILYRTQCIKIARLLAEKGRGQGGQAWVVNFYKNVFEKKKGLNTYSVQQKKEKWKDQKIVEEYEEEKRAHRWLVQSRNRLLRLYDVVSGMARLLSWADMVQVWGGSYSRPCV
jgi:ribosomal protein S4